MRFVGIDIASETHVLAVVAEDQSVLLKPVSFKEDAAGYELLWKKLGSAKDTLVTLEATGHYWQNLFAALVTRGFSVALINPLRSHRFAQEDLERTKTDAIDALGLARFGAQKRPRVTLLRDAATDELRELVRLRDRLVQDLHDLGQVEEIAQPIERRKSFRNSVQFDCKDCDEHRDGQGNGAKRRQKPHHQKHPAEEFNRGQEYVRVSHCRAGAPPTWTLWSHAWSPPTPGRYDIRLRIDDPAVGTRRLDAGYYERTVDIREV